MKPETWYRWLLFAAAVVVGIGAALVVLALLGVPPELMTVLYLPGEPDVASATTLSFAIGVTGSVMVGWGASMLYVYLDRSTVDRPRVARAFFVGTVATARPKTSCFSSSNRPRRGAARSSSEAATARTNSEVCVLRSSNMPSRSAFFAPGS